MYIVNHQNTCLIMIIDILVATGEDIMTGYSIILLLLSPIAVSYSVKIWKKADIKSVHPFG